jgi:hypothetical protein
LTSLARLRQWRANLFRHLAVMAGFDRHLMAPAGALWPVQRQATAGRTGLGQLVKLVEMFDA